MLIFLYGRSVHVFDAVEVLMHAYTKLNKMRNLQINAACIKKVS
jgi:hypothetical protein